MILELVEAGYPEEHLWNLTYSQLKRRLEARRRLLALRRIESMAETYYGVRGTQDAIDDFVDANS